MMADGQEKATRGSRQRKKEKKRGKGVREVVSETSEDDGYVCFALHSGGLNRRQQVGGGTSTTRWRGGQGGQRDDKR
ncbi:Multiple RNA-binding domain-containing protein 1 [Fusarium oxysporum f. sp. albedinis]|nr:Multiple RNA-binding domain-containing protein 1 [Fusarium oxysporum f. sp. albedinis]